MINETERLVPVYIQFLVDFSHGSCFFFAKFQQYKLPGLLYNIQIKNGEYRQHLDYNLQSKLWRPLWFHPQLKKVVLILGSIRDRICAFSLSKDGILWKSVIILFHGLIALEKSYPCIWKSCILFRERYWNYIEIYTTF